jgi:hypothetical protein
MKRLLHLSALLILIVGIVSFSFPDEKEKGKSSKLNSTSISGKIIDAKTSETLVGVSVELEGTDYSTYTDFEGNFVFEDLQPGNYKITTSLVSYQKKTSEIELEGKNKINIK